MKFKFPLHFHITTLFVLLVILVGGLIGGLGYKFSRDMLESTATDLTQRISRETLGDLQRLVAAPEMVVNLMSYDALIDATTLQARLQRLGFIRKALDNSTALSSVYIGYASGDFFFVRHVRDEAERQVFKAPEGTTYIVQSIERNVIPARGRYIFLDDALKTLREDDRADYAASYDPRSRGWYQEASVAPSQIKTPPYLFFSNRKVGTTIATHLQNGIGVVGADILLETLSANLSRQKVTPGTQVVLVNPKGFVIAHENVAKLVTVPNTPDAKPSLTRLENMGTPVLTALSPHIKDLDGSATFSSRIEINDDDWRIAISPVQLEGSQPLYLITAIPERELLAAALKFRSISLWVTALIMLLSIPITWLIARGLSGALRQLVGEAEAIRRFEFSNPVKVSSLVKEVDELGQTMDGMKKTIRRFLDINMAVAAEDNFSRLLPRLLTETISASGASAGVIYLSDGEGLSPMCALHADGSQLAGAELDILRQLVLPNEALSALDNTLMGKALSTGAVCSDKLQPADIESLGLEQVDDIDTAPGEQKPTHAIAVPLLNRQRQIVGAMLLLLQSESDDALVSFVGALSGSAAVTLETRELIKAQKELFEAFIQMIAGAVDAKSPYTGGHCTRVPELTKMLARAACADTEGAYKDFQLGEGDWEAVHVASWLHDCGKVTTPEYVVDKATKLETIYDRIHEVRMRFEVLKRDAEIAYLKEIAAGNNDAEAHQRLTAELHQLDEDYIFVATSNEGGEFMAPEKQARLKTIAQRSWLRTLDDRIGISHEEKARKAATPPSVLPVAEPLLADKPEHLFVRRTQDRMAPDNKWGFRMEAPELLYNKGELYNLSVARGTLSEEERYKINEHIVQTLIMLSQLPFPKHLRSVPEIAGGHHEKMDGTGYPKRLKKEDMSPVARMMAIADVFEALTAVDRPYKKGKTLSEAIKIMSFMKKDQHIDPDLFDLFLRSGVYQAYAEKFMKPEQIDGVDIASYLSTSKI